MAEISSLFGPYQIGERLGQGGMGVVYRARHVETGQEVALKAVRVVRAGLLKSLRMEILALSRLRHRGIVRILAQGLHQGLPWYAMELLQGQNLDDWWSSRGTSRTCDRSA